MKKQIFTLLALLAVSILPGCGKGGEGSVGVYTSNATLNGNCYDILSLYQAGAGFTGTFASNSGYADGYNVAGSMYGASISMPGVSYTRTNVAGDSIQIGVAGSGTSYGYYGGSSNVALYAYVTLAPATIQAMAYYNQRYICGISVNSAASGGVLQQSAYILGAYGNTGLSI